MSAQYNVSSVQSPAPPSSRLLPGLPGPAPVDSRSLEEGRSSGRPAHGRAANGPAPAGGKAERAGLFRRRRAGGACSIGNTRTSPRARWAGFWVGPPEEKDGFCRPPSPLPPRLGSLLAMIEVSAALLRGAVFLAGEVLECLVTLRNPLPPDATSASSEMLAWASAQIHCQFHASESRVVLPPSDDHRHDVQAENETVFVPNRGERGHCILSTPPKILFCDLRLDPGESKTYSYCETLPVDGPPSFRGQAVKYVYKLTIGCQRVNSPIKLLRVPFRVLVLHGLKDYQFPQDEAVAPSNPFLEEEEGVKKDSRLADLATELLMVATSRRSLHVYNISNTRGKVGTFCIFKTVYKIGEDIVGSFNFSEGDIPCLQYLVSLQTEERIQEAFQRRHGQPVSYSTHARHQESCLHTSRTSFSLPIPLSSAPGFSTNIVSLKWRLHFEFVTSRDSAQMHVASEGHSGSLSWTGVEQMDVDTFSWDLPVKVLPTNPLLASYISQFPGSNSLTI
ncbi:RAB6A-GEF complex partner protein 2 [Rhineura floridana]|uniref:RAB6A-GEF complex partner protein 2 n=1 Tax=Rhineura floridana TaxID=261503 RepID=UPI002AC88FA8|nr:RAB6A-GEF complex partner protein 2 [Rhineura floridana]